MRRLWNTANMMKRILGIVPRRRRRRRRRRRCRRRRRQARRFRNWTLFQKRTRSCYRVYFPYGIYLQLRSLARFLK